MTKGELKKIEKEEVKFEFISYGIIVHANGFF